jgi:hypothetical protein
MTGDNRGQIRGQIGDKTRGQGTGDTHPYKGCVPVVPEAFVPEMSRQPFRDLTAPPSGWDNRGQIQGLRGQTVSPRGFILP